MLTVSVIVIVRTNEKPEIIILTLILLTKYSSMFSWNSGSRKVSSALLLISGSVMRKGSIWGTWGIRPFSRVRDMVRKRVQGQTCTRFLAIISSINREYWMLYCISPLHSTPTRYCKNDVSLFQFTELTLTALQASQTCKERDRDNRDNRDIRDIRDNRDNRDIHCQPKLLDTL